MTTGFSKRRLDVPTLGSVRNLLLPQREFLALIEVPGCITIRAQHGLVAGRPCGRRLSVYYAFQSQDQMKEHFTRDDKTGLFDQMLMQAREQASFEQVFLTFEDSPNRPWVEPIFEEVGFQIHDEWIRMALADPTAWKPTPDLAQTAVIREAGASDIEAIAAIDAASFGEAAWGADGQAALQSELAWSVVAEVEGEIVGYIQLRRTSDNAGEIFALTVHPRHRGHGYGTQMLERALTWLLDANVRRVESVVSTGHTTGLDLLRRYGFVPHRSGLTYRRPADDRLVQVAIQEAVKRSFLVKFGDWR